MTAIHRLCARLVLLPGIMFPLVHLAHALRRHSNVPLGILMTTAQPLQQAFSAQLPVILFLLDQVARVLPLAINALLAHQIMTTLQLPTACATCSSPGYFVPVKSNVLCTSATYICPAGTSDHDT